MIFAKYLHVGKNLIVGGFAVIEYAEPRYTKDLDVWVRAETANAERVSRALSRFGAPRNTHRTRR